MVSAERPASAVKIVPSGPTSNACPPTKAPWEKRSSGRTSVFTNDAPAAPCPPASSWFLPGYLLHPGMLCVHPSCLLLFSCARESRGDRLQSSPPPEP